MRPLLGINNCFAAKRWPAPDEWSDLIAKELGLGLVQHSLDLTDLPLEDSPSGRASMEREALAIRSAAERSGLAIDSLFTGLAAYSHGLMLASRPSERDSGSELWRRAIELTALTGAGCFGGHLGSLSRRDADDAARRQARWAELRERLEALRANALSEGVGTLLVENMACDREPSRMAELSSLLAGADGGMAALSLCLDVGHQCVPGTSGPERDPYAWLRALGDQARVIHLQQSDAAADHHWPFTAEHNRLGRIEAARVLDALAAAGATSPTLILEVIPAFEAEDRTVLEQLRESVTYWQDALSRLEGGSLPDETLS